MSNEPEQLSLDLEYATYDHYTVTLSKGDVGDMVVLRKHDAHDVDGAINFVESLRDSAANRDSVTWQHDEVDAQGILYGLAPGGVVFEISVFPPLSTELAR